MEVLYMPCGQIGGPVLWRSGNLTGLVEMRWPWGPAGHPGTWSRRQLDSQAGAQGRCLAANQGLGAGRRLGTWSGGPNQGPPRHG